MELFTPQLPAQSKTVRVSESDPKWISSLKFSSVFPLPLIADILYKIKVLTANNDMCVLSWVYVMIGDISSLSLINNLIWISLNLISSKFSIISWNNLYFF